MTRQTSIDAYRTIVESGRLGESKCAVYRWLFEHGPATRNELDQALGHGNPNPTFSRRLTELEALGVVARVGQRRCLVTDYKSDLWDVTDKLPGQTERKPSRRKRAEDLVRELSLEVRKPAAKVFPDSVLERVRTLIERWEKEDAA
jgi:hypothetical protein